jgi:WD40 repeat protein/class 3 adenylate cyclase
METLPRAPDETVAVRSFLIADVRGYTRFTREHGDVEAARLAKKFADLARDAVEARGGRVLELRGDEALAVFASSAQAARAAIEFQATCAEETAANPTLPLLVGIGIDTGEAVPLEEGYRGVALNMAARLCSAAAAGQVLVSSMVAEQAAGGGIRFREVGMKDLKGFDSPVQVLEATPTQEASQASAAGGPEAVVGDREFPIELDALTPLVDRDHEMRWLRGTWRQVRRGHGRVLFVSGPTQIGKTRLASEIARFVHDTGGFLRYAGPGGTATADALGVLREAEEAVRPSLFVLDDLDAASDGPALALKEAVEGIERRPVLVLCLVQDPDGNPNVAEVIAAIDGRGDGHRRLEALDLDGVRDIARLYAGEDVAQAPLESIERSSGGIPGRIHEVMSEWARTEATRRLAAAAEYLAVGRTRRSADLEFANNVIGLKLGRLYTVGADTIRVEHEPTCPFKGLASFEPEDAQYFFGRERLVGELAARTVQVGLLGVVGASGSGKSSVVSAGLLPSLRAGLLPGSERWSQVRMRPGEHPIAELRATLATQLGESGTDGSLSEVVDRAAPDDRLVLFVDQFEEVFTTCSDETERAAFVEDLADAAHGSPDRVVVVLALRGDFYGHCAEYPALAEMLSANHVPIGSMTPEELHRAIELPARRVGLRVESALVDALASEVAEQPGGLPLLSTALVELWRERSDGWLRLEAAERTGGVHGAVARLAESTFDQMSEGEQETAKNVFLRLTGPGEGEAITRRRVPISEFDLGREEVAASVIGRLTADRLITKSDSTVEVAHEALFREWPRLRGWLEEDTEGRQVHRHLIQAAQQWEGRGRDDAELYRGTRLSAALDWSATRGRELNELEREFVAQSRQASERETKRIRRTNRRLRGLLVGTAIFLIIALIAGSVALVQRGHARTAASAAEHSANVALSQSLGAKGVAEPGLVTGLLLATEGVRLDNSLETQSDLLSTLERSPSTIGVINVSIGGSQPQVIAVSPDGRTLAVTDDKGQLSFYDTSTRKLIGKSLTGFAAYSSSGMAFTPDGSVVVAQNDAGTPKLVDTRTHAVLKSFPGSKTGAGTQGLALSPDGRIAYSQSGSFVARWDLSAGRELPPVRVGGNFDSFPAVAADTGDVVTMTTDRGGWIQVRNGTTLALERQFPLDQVPALYALSVTPDGGTAVVTSDTSDDPAVRFINLRTGKVQTGVGGSGGIWLIMSPDGRFVADVGGSNGPATSSGGAASITNTLLWDVGSGRVVQALTGHAGQIIALAFDGSGRTLYTASAADGTVFAYDLVGGRAFGRPMSVGGGNNPFPWNNGGLANVAASPDGTEIATTGPHGVVNITDVATGKAVTSFRATDTGLVYGAEFSPDGRELLTIGDAGDIGLWRLGSGSPTLIRRFTGPLGGRTFMIGDHEGTFASDPWATFSPDGRWIAEVDTKAILKDGQPVAERDVLAEWNTATGAARAAPLDFTPPGAQGIWSDWEGGNIAFSADGRWIAVTSAKQVLVVDASSLKIVRRLAGDPNGGIWLTFSHSGRILASAGFGGLVHLWSVGSWRLLNSVQVIAGNLHTIAFDRSDQELLVTGPGGRTGLWSVPKLQEIGSELPHALSDYGGWSMSTLAGSSIVLVYTDGEAFVWPGTVQGWQQQACRVAGRNFTRTEWNLFLPGRPYEKTCPSL